MNYKHNPDTDFKSIENLDKDEAKKQIDALRKAIDYHDYLYYVKNKPEISDATYDRLFNRLKELEREFPEFQSENSPTRRVGAKPVDELESVEHVSPMLSLDSSRKKEKIKDFIDRVNKESSKDGVCFHVEPKFDGFSVEIVYENGRFKRGATRGDGYTGEDISRNLRTIRTIPLQLQSGDVPGLVALRGEVYMPRSGFQQLNKRMVEKGKDAFANPRNAAAGIMRQLNPKNVQDKPLNVYFYEILQISENPPGKHDQALAMLKKWGLRVNDKNKILKTADRIEEYHQNMARRREDLEYEIDGVVIKVNDYKVREKMGARQRNPRWAIAWKFEPKHEITRLEDIAVQVGRTGKLTPVALLDPVDVGGVTVSRASLHNEGETQKKDVRPDDKVRVIRAGDVIPEIAERVEKGKHRPEMFSMPDKCPVCGGEVETEGAYHFCSAGLSCPARLKGVIQHYASKEAFDIEGLGEKTVGEMVERGMVKDVAGLYSLQKEEIKTLEGFAEKSADNLYNAIQNAKKIRLDRFLYAIGIRHVGLHAARILAKHFQNLDNIINADTKALRSINEIGPEIAKSVRKFFEEKKNLDVVKRLKDAGVKVIGMQEKGPMPLKGKTFVFTGSLDDFTRDEAKRTVEDLGARATSSVSGETDYIVVGENPGSKLDKAKKEKKAIIDEKQFRKLINR